MKIERIRIESFGRLSDFELNLSQGINILEGPNESGKSTIAAFIRFIFYGLSAKAEGDISPREQFLSWSTAQASGSLTVRVSEGQYRIERALVKSGRGLSEHLTVVDLTTGAILKNQDPAAMFMAGVPEEVFCRTAFVGQADGSFIDGQKIGQAIENILSSADESVNTKKAIKRLDDARVMLLYKNKKGGKIYELENEKEDLLARAHRAEEDCRLMAEKKKLLSDTNATLKKNEEQLRILEDKLAYTDASRRLQQIEKSKQAEEQLQNATEELDDTVASLLHGDFCPNKAYLQALERMGKQLIQISEEKKKLSSKIEGARNEADAEEVWADAETIAKLHSHRRKSDKLRLCAILMLLPAVMLCAVGFFASLLILTIPIPVLLLAISGALFFLQAREKKAFDAILLQLGAEDEEAATEIIALCAAKNAKIEAAKQSLAELEAERTAVVQAEAAMWKDAIALAAKWGKTLTDQRSMAELIREAELACNRLDMASDEKQRCELAYKNLYTVASEEEVAALSEILQNGGTELSGEDYTKACNNRKFYRQTIDMLQKRKRETEHLLIELRTKTEIPEDLRLKATELEGKIRSLRLRHDAYLLAIQKLTEASVLLRSRITPALAGQASEFLSHTTEGKYQSVGVADDFSLSYSDGNATRSTDFLSCGTKDLAYLGLRLGLSKALFKDEEIPMVFDESFARLDDRRLATVFTYLADFAAKGGQILLMTSGRRERKYADAIGNCNVIQL